MRFDLNNNSNIEEDEIFDLVFVSGNKGIQIIKNGTKRETMSNTIPTTVKKIPAITESESTLPRMQNQ